MAPPPEGVTAALLLAQASHEHGDKRWRAARNAAVRCSWRRDLGIARTFVDSGEWAMSLVRELRDVRRRVQPELRDDYLDRLLQMARGRSTRGRPFDAP